MKSSPLAFSFIFPILCQLATAAASSTASAVQTMPSAPTIEPPPAALDTLGASKGNSNPVGQLAGYVKDSFVRMKDGSVQLYTNHQRCNEIRAKQRQYLAIAAAALPDVDEDGECGRIARAANPLLI